jgi:hypothetical protein
MSFAKASGSGAGYAPLTDGCIAHRGSTESGSVVLDVAARSGDPTLRVAERSDGAVDTDPLPKVCKIVTIRCPCRRYESC